MCKALDYAQKITDILLEAKEETEKYGNIVHECDLKTCDILHQIEIEEIKGLYDAWIKIQQIKRIRKIRREAKDEIRTLKLITGLDNQNLILDVDEEMRKMSKRKYNPRCDCKFTDLKCKIG